MSVVSDFAMIYNFGGDGKWNDWEYRRRARLDGRIIAKLMNIALLGLFGLTVVGLGIISFEKWLSETLNTMPESKGVNFKSYGWQKRCRGLYETPIAA